MKIFKPLNIHIGKKINDRRHRVSMTLCDLAQKLGISVPQLHKYEQGTTRIPVDCLYKLGHIFKVSVNFFFEDFNYDPIQALEFTDPDTISMNGKAALNILMIEDDAGDEFITRKFIEEYDSNNSVYTVHDGVKALDFLRNKQSFPFFRPDLIILDLNIPKRDGLTVLKEIKRDSKIQDIPVVVVTNSLSKQEMVEVYRKYASGYICKSGELNIFKSRIEGLIKYWSSIVILPRSDKGMNKEVSRST